MKITRPKSLTEMVVEELRTRIIDGRLRLGEALSENALAADLGISKTPVREALLQLKLERLVDVLPQRGTYVFRMAPDQVVDDQRVARDPGSGGRGLGDRAQPCRAGHADERNLRGHARGLRAVDNAAYRMLDGEFHQAIIDLCGNPYTSDAYGQVGFRTQALRSRLSDEAALNRLSFKDHREMLKLIKARDVPLAEADARAHPTDHEILSRRAETPRCGCQANCLDPGTG